MLALITEPTTELRPYDPVNQNLIGKTVRLVEIG
jgi:hypothetical protein